MRLTNLRHLRVFEAVCRLSSFVEASKALHMSPAAVSLAIRELETELGFRVLDRTTRVVQLSTAGARYFDHVQRVLSEVRAAEVCAKSLRNGMTQTVRIATTPPVISSLLRLVFEQAPIRWPHVQVTPIELPLQALPDAIANRQADITIGVRLPMDSAFATSTLFMSHWLALLPRNHRFAQRESLAWHEIVTEPIILISESSRLKLQSALPPELLLEDVMEVSTTATALASAACGRGIALVPGYVRPLAQVHDLCAISLIEPVLPHRLEIAIASRNSPDSATVQIRDFLVAEVQGKFAHLSN